MPGCFQNNASRKYVLGWNTQHTNTLGTVIMSSNIIPISIQTYAKVHMYELCFTVWKCPVGFPRAKASSL